jgi:hypothetical protein
MVGRKRRGFGFLIYLSLICCIAGSFVGDLIRPYLPDALNKSFNIGFSPFPLDLKVVKFTLGFSLQLNVVSILGLLVAIILYTKFL